MEYIIHVIDESSQHKKIEQDSQELQIVQGQAENGEFGDIIRSDAFYLVSDTTPIDAVITLSNIIKIKDAQNQITSLSSILSNSSKDNENSSIDEDTFIPIKIDNFVIAENTNSELIKTSCQIKRETNEDSWIEFHNIYFYVIQREKVIFVK